MSEYLTPVTDIVAVASYQSKLSNRLFQRIARANLGQFNKRRRRRATPVITSTFENVSDIGVCLGLSLGPPAIAGVRSKRGALHTSRKVRKFTSRGNSKPVNGRTRTARAATTEIVLRPYSGELIMLDGRKDELGDAAGFDPPEGQEAAA
jgi:hypothetical protein